MLQTALRNYSKLSFEIIEIQMIDIEIQMIEMIEIQMIDIEIQMIEMIEIQMIDNLMKLLNEIIEIHYI